MNTNPPGQPEPLPDPLGPLPAKKTWKAGTLLYTSGGITALFVWLIWGDFAWGMRDRSVGPMAAWYLDHLNVPKVLFGLLLSSFPAALGLILGPIISMKSDRHRSKRGRRIPFLLVTTPIAAVGMIGLAWTPVLAEWLQNSFGVQDRMLVALICFGVFWALFEFATIIGQAVFGGLINDVVPKPLLGRFFGLFRAVSLLDGIIFNFWIMGKVPEHFTLILTIIGIFYGAAFMWVCYHVKEGEYPPPPAGGDTAASAMGKFLGGAKTYFKECFTSSYYISIFVMIMAGVLCFVPINVFAIPYARSLGISMETYGKYLALTYTISLSISFFLGWLADIFHPLRMAIVSLVVYLAVTICGAIFATTDTTFLIAWVVHGVLSGCYMTVSASIPQQLFPHQRFAQFASAAGIFTSAGNVLLAPLVGTAIDQSGVYRYTFVAGSFLSALALLAAWYVYIRFKRLGGPGNYTAPEE